MITVYFTSFSEALPQEKISLYLSQVPEVFRNKILRYRQWEDRHASLFGKLLLKEAFSATASGKYRLEDIFIDDHDKPHVKGDLFFNISHSGSYVVCAVGEKQMLGIDIE